MFKSELVVIPGGSPHHVDPPRSTKETQFSNNLETRGRGKKNANLRQHSGGFAALSQKVLAFCTKVSAELTKPLFSVSAESGECNRLELRRDISEQLLHE